MIKVDDKFVLKVREYFSIHHVQSAAMFARLAGGIEQEAGRVPPDESISHQHRAYVVASVFAAVAFLEATINEFSSDVGGDAAVSIYKMKIGNNAAVRKVLQLGAMKRRPLLTKFEMVLALLNKESLANQPCYQAVTLLVELRNRLVHYEPQWVTVFSEIETTPVTVQDLEKRLKRKFALNPLVPTANAFFPDRCLSHGCAAWAVTQSVELVDDFCRILGVAAAYNHVRSRLDTT